VRHDDGTVIALEALTALTVLATVACKAGSRGRIPMAGLAKGTLLYHGTRVPEDFDYPDGPAWFSTSEGVAQQFISWHEVGGDRRPRIYTYRVTRRIPRLPLIEGSHTWSRFLDTLPGGADEIQWQGPRDMAQIVCDEGYSGWHIAHNYPDGGSDTMLCDPEDWLELVEVEEHEDDE
jgi:hypothetical protein